MKNTHLKNTHLYEHLKNVDEFINKYFKLCKKFNLMIYTRDWLLDDEYNTNTKYRCEVIPINYYLPIKNKDNFDRVEIQVKLMKEQNNDWIKNLESILKLK